jgi:hypothetical protein
MLAKAVSGFDVFVPASLLSSNIFNLDQSPFSYYNPALTQVLLISS